MVSKESIKLIHDTIAEGSSGEATAREQLIGRMESLEKKEEVLKGLVKLIKTNPYMPVILHRYIDNYGE